MGCNGCKYETLGIKRAKYQVATETLMGAGRFDNPLHPNVLYLLLCAVA